MSPCRVDALPKNCVFALETSANMIGGLGRACSPRKHAKTLTLPIVKLCNWERHGHNFLTLLQYLPKYTEVQFSLNIKPVDAIHIFHSEIIKINNMCIFDNQSSVRMHEGHSIPLV